MGRGRLFVVSGPSGAGKSTVCKQVRRDLNINLATSATTRSPREGEEEGREYYFLTLKEFEKRIENDEFLEYANVHGNYYGTLKSEAESRLSRGENVVLEIDVQGGIQIKKRFEDACLVFFKAPTEKILEERLRGRGTEAEETVQLRLKNSLKEMAFEDEYDHVIVNETVDKSVSELIEIIRKESN
ncbi:MULTISPECIES: guanylate kinase [Psychrilyobacter]|uniref:Guanylate kinase n=1 Tax=Psychrilyobacter piezotolerans TaxID=2293438 RepID=A0ABX9KE79_9FUSO|nr:MULTISPECIES: guanylate kinase [Psychrilyobacter]MCS5422720.1 guanylate kinase [Psychrilyobacter sp. S5]NDI78990.1 guanylate kinase [Psychrilyobacter piezotolerans]RDE59211.1 guanylate kinase [Psychrilyobacter sp. S5]REI39778.1 guanylate kinase [Psychrilyobacter piezotolerans]